MKYISTKTFRKETIQTCFLKPVSVVQQLRCRDSSFAAMASPDEIEQLADGLLPDSVSELAEAAALGEMSLSEDDSSSSSPPSRFLRTETNKQTLF